MLVLGSCLIDSYSNFLFLNRDGCPKTNVNYATMFRGLAKKYNKCHEEALQYIMGHSNITMTLNYYAHATFASAKAEMEGLIAA
jgi:integrase